MFGHCSPDLAASVETQKSHRRIIGCDQLWMLGAHLDDHEPVAEMSTVS